MQPRRENKMEKRKILVVRLELQLNDIADIELNLASVVERTIG